ncbi:MAG: transpeptidase family protein [Candidatus Marinimicrobia bacterium]|nr:transpeptidase family protein [Candidatus Neomarinimicrobiota bacterium]
MQNNKPVNIKLRTFFISSIMLLFWILIVSKFFFIQVVNNDIYKNACQMQSQDSVKIEPQRGNFLDRNNNILTSNITLYNIGINTTKDSPNSGYSEFLERHFSKSKEYYTKISASRAGVIWIARDTILSREIIDSLRYFKGAVLDTKINRNYHTGKSTGPLLGYTTNNTGICGLEEALEKQLAGKPGWQLVEKDGRGNQRPLYNRLYRRAINGNQIKLTINQNYQNILYEEINHVYKKYKADNAKGIIIDPHSGEILAMASCPSFDPNNRKNISPEYLKNRVISDIYEPGSTFKIVTATAALESQSVSPKDTIHCEEGEITIQGRTIHDHEQYPAMTFREVIKHSSNVGSILAAQKTGKERLFRYTTKFGFGSETNIILDNEEEGILPAFHKWTDLRTAQIAMGHGIGCTVLQLAYAYGAIANEGDLMRPVIIKKITSPEGRVIHKNRAQVIRKVASRKTMQTLCSILRDVVSDGTGIKADIQGMSIAGKTGTAQKPTANGYSNNQYIASFAGFFPASNPKLVAIIVVDNPKGAVYYGGYVAAPAVRNVFKRIVNASNEMFFDNHDEPKYVHHKKNNQEQLKKTKESPTDSPQLLSKIDRIHALDINKKKSTFEMPNVIGFPASSAIGALQRLGLKVKLKGSGKVISQYPRQGQKVKIGNTCILQLQS